MYDIITPKKINKGKIIILIMSLILLVSLSTISGIKLADYNNKRKQAKEYQSQQEKIEYEEMKKKEEEEKKRQLEIKKRIEQTSRPLSEEEKDRILHIYRSTGEKRVFLTFDDGPSKAVTPLILDVLKKESVEATFFVLGNNAKYNQDILKREFEEGHYIANHGYSHKYSEIYSSPDATFNEYNVTEQIIKDALENQAYTSRLFRFPGGSNGGYYDSKKQASKALLRENGIIHLDWNCLNTDAVGNNSKEDLMQSVINTMENKDSIVILMHDAGDKILTYEMLKDLIPYLKEQGYKFKNIYDLLD